MSRLRPIATLLVSEAVLVARTGGVEAASG